MTARIVDADCLAAMARMEADSIDAIVTDPPYGLSFMGKEWDHGVPGEPFWREALRVAKPGAHLVAFGGTRTYHRLACAIEDAGWEIRDSLCWLYGSGFPKSLDVSKAIDKAMGAEREVVGTYNARGFSGTSPTEDGRNQWAAGEVTDKIGTRTAPATDLARQWQGWGTALKPAYEPIVLARKPLIGTVAANVEQHGVGGINIDGCRIATDDNLNGGAYAKDGTQRHDGAENWRYKREGGAGEFSQPSGRWPANVLLDEEAGALLDAQAGPRGASAPVKGTEPSAVTNGIYGDFAGRVPGAFYGDAGGPSRFFYCAKASPSERNAGVEGKNVHPTVKPVALMRYLVRLVTPPGGLVLDPFCGSGTTGVAAVAEGARFVGIELDPAYAGIARARLAKHRGDR